MSEAEVNSLASVSHYMDAGKILALLEESQPVAIHLKYKEKLNILIELISRARQWGVTEKKDLLILAGFEFAYGLEFEKQFPDSDSLQKLLMNKELSASDKMSELKLRYDKIQRTYNPES